MIQYGYDVAGNLQSVLQPNGITTWYSYDTLNRLTAEIVEKGQGDFVASYRYQLRPDGRRASVLERHLELDGSYSEALVSYAYDANGRLIGEVRDRGNDGPDASDLAIDYTFDLANNRVAKSIDHARDGTFDEIVTYLYNANDELVREDSTIDLNDVTYTHDANGSMARTLSAGTAKLYVWDLRSRLAGVDTDDDGEVNHAGDVLIEYNTSGVREFEAFVGGEGTVYLIDPFNPTGHAKPLEEKTDPTGLPMRSYLFGLRVEGQADAKTGPIFLIADGRGSTRSIADLSGAIIQRVDYEAFGTIISDDISENLLSDWLFGNDGMYDVETNLTYHVRRWRNDSRFVSVDPFAGSPSEPRSLHKYVYAGMDAVNFGDPSGMMTSIIDLKATIAIGSLMFLAMAVAFVPARQQAQSMQAAVDAVAVVKLAAVEVVNGGIEGAGDVWDRAEKAGREIFRERHRFAMGVKKIIAGATLGFAAGSGFSKQIPVYPVVKSLTPNIFRNTEGWILAAPQWGVLTYPGPDPVGSRTRRALAVGGLGPAGWGKSWDEFPYASTLQGGLGSFVAAVPAPENWVQGGTLSAFYLIGMKRRYGDFVVFPFPI